MKAKPRKFTFLHKRPRITDVAELAGVSVATVSVVVNDRVGEQIRVSPEVQQKVWAAVTELGYVANPVAQSLAGGWNKIIAVFTFEPIFPIDSRNFYHPFLVGIEEAAADNGIDLLLVTGSTQTDHGRHIYQKGINRLQRADGAILLGHGNREEVVRLLEEKYPFVFVGRRESPQDNISYVAADYAAATVQLVEHLLQHDHRRLAYIRSTRATEASTDRERAVRQALAPVQLPDNWLWSGNPHQLTQTVLSDYLAKGFTAFVVEDDELGQHLLSLAAELNLQCPRDFSLVVLGNPLSPLIEVPDWTSFNIPRREMGREALKILLELLATHPDENRAPQRKVLECTLKLGSSVRKAI